MVRAFQQLVRPRRHHGIGDRRGVAPISLEAVEQVQVAVAPYDVRQGNFTGAGVNTVTRSGTNQVTGSVYYRTRSETCGSDERRQLLGLCGHHRWSEPSHSRQLQDEDEGCMDGWTDREE